MKLLLPVLIPVYLLFFLLRSGYCDMSDFTGSQTCRECHSRFHELWKTSRHGTSLMRYDKTFAREQLTPQKDSIAIAGKDYFAHLDKAIMTEDGEIEYPIEYAIGGKNVYYFLTTLDKGRLQTLPLAYNVKTNQWYDMAQSGVRHFTDIEDQPYHWTDRPYIFNSRCYSCHVSQYSQNYDLKTDTYRTTWQEAGINCETCHGPVQEHIRTYREAREDESTVKDPKIKVITQKRNFSQYQVSGACSICHTKGAAITNSYFPGEEYFDHYDMITFEHPDFYPDGRDLGENYTFTLWRMNPCVTKGKLDCMHCHTSSGRNRFTGEKANDACVACHEKRVQNAEAHTHHPPGSEGNKCVSCHMPMTRFAAMQRSDHSFRPPMPLATLKFNSPNACNICHDDKDAAWANQQVRQWHKEEYQKPVLEVASLIAEARKGNWKDLPTMLAYLQREDRDEIFANSLVRLLCACPEDSKWPVLLDMIKKDPSPLIRSSIASAMRNHLTPETIQALCEATQDTYRLVRIRAGATLSIVPDEHIPATMKASVAKAMEECLLSYEARPDYGIQHYNQGNFYMNRHKYQKAVESFETAYKLRDDFIPSLINVSMAYNAIGDNKSAERSLRKAIMMDPNSEAAWLNLGLLLGEMDQSEEAIKAFTQVVTINPKSAQAAYNMGILFSEKEPTQSLAWCQTAYKLEPENVKYAYTLAYYLVQAQKTRQATDLLEALVDKGIYDVNALKLLIELYRREGAVDKIDILIKRLESAGGLK